MADENNGGADTIEPSGDQTTDTTDVTQDVDSPDTGDTSNESGETDNSSETASDEEDVSLLGESDDQKSSDDKEGDEQDSDKDKDGEEDAETVTYEEFDLPEDVDEGMLKATTELFAKHGLSQEAAQEIIDTYAKQILLGQQEQEDAVAETHRQWAKDLKADREYGGANLKVTARNAQGAFKKYADDGFTQLMRDTGLEKHPAIIKTFARIGQDVLEDEVSDDPANQQTRSVGDGWYDK